MVDMRREGGPVKITSETEEKIMQQLRIGPFQTSTKIKLRLITEWKKKSRSLQVVSERWP